MGMMDGNTALPLSSRGHRRPRFDREGIGLIVPSARRAPSTRHFVNRAFSPHLRHFIAAVAGIAVLTTAGMARAVTAIWDPPNNGDRDFSTPGNWSTGVVPGSADDVVADGNVANNRIDVDVAIDVKSITTQNGYSGNINFTGSSANSIRVRGNVTLGGTGDFECCDLERQGRAGTRCTQQFEHPAVLPFEDLRFPALSDEAQATR